MYPYLEVQKTAKYKSEISLCITRSYIYIEQVVWAMKLP